MNGFESARTVEAKGFVILRPYLEEHASGGLVVTSKGTLAKHLQLIVGDVLFNDRHERLWAVELKIEQRYTGNLFIETWSNRNTESRASHAERGCNRGWLDHCRADLILYYFIDTDDLFVIDLFKLKQWAFGTGENGPNIHRFPEKKQMRYDQKNDTWGRLIHKDVLVGALGVGFKHCRVRQLSLLLEVNSNVAEAAASKSATILPGEARW